MSYLFSGSKFNGDISKWNVSNAKEIDNMFHISPLENKPEFQSIFKN